MDSLRRGCCGGRSHGCPCGAIPCGVARLGRGGRASRSVQEPNEWSCGGDPQLWAGELLALRVWCLVAPLPR